MRPTDRHSPTIRTRAAALALACVVAAPAATAAIARPIAPEGLATRSVLVVEARVASIETAIDPQGPRLSTYVTLDVERVDRGPEGLERLILRQPGGRFGTLINAVDGVPRWSVDDRVLAFLEPAADGALRPVGLFLGVFVVDEDGRNARRELDGQGLLIGGDPRSASTSVERWSLADLRAAAATRVPRRGTRPWSAEPPERGRLVRPGDELPASVRAMFAALAAPPTSASGVVELAADGPAPTADPRFTTLLLDHPLRFMQLDDGVPVEVALDPGRAPLAAEATDETISRALASWSDAPESRVVLARRAADFDALAEGHSPAAAPASANAIVFGDPYDEIPDPVDCAGTLAIGGAWGTTAISRRVNGVTFYAATRLYVVLNDGFDCVLGDSDDLGEVVAHELGHGLGLGHSAVDDALMRAWAWHDRGPRLGLDDRDAVRCVYPHTLLLDSPSAGAVLDAGSTIAVHWTRSAETGPARGVVDVELSDDGGASWTTIAGATPDDGETSWTVPSAAAGPLTLRVSGTPLAGPPGAPWPERCASATVEGLQTVVHVPSAGAVPGDGLRVERGPGGTLRLGWSASCSGEADDHAIYAGSLDDLRAGEFAPLPLTCAAGPDLAEYVDPGDGDRYFLVAPLAGGLEGALGAGVGGAARPAPQAACAPRETDPVCGSPPPASPPPGGGIDGPKNDL